MILVPKSLKLNAIFPIAAIIVVVAGAVAYMAYKDNYVPPSESDFKKAHEPSLDAVTPAVARDHHLGDLGVPVQLVVFTDFECPYCRQFHTEDIPQLHEKYGEDINVVYRNLPLPHRFAESRNEATAAECVSELAGESAYWAYVDRLFDSNPSSRTADQDQTQKLASELGINSKEFNSCVEMDKVGYRIDAEMHMASHAGITATPSIVVMIGGEKTIIVGSRPQTLMSTIDTMLTETDI